MEKTPGPSPSQPEKGNWPMNEKLYTNPAPAKQQRNSPRYNRPVSIGEAVAKVMNDLAKVAQK